MVLLLSHSFVCCFIFILGLEDEGSGSSDDENDRAAMAISCKFICLILLLLIFHELLILLNSFFFLGHYIVICGYNSQTNEIERLLA